MTTNEKEMLLCSFKLSNSLLRLCSNAVAAALRICFQLSPSNFCSSDLLLPCLPIQSLLSSSAEKLRCSRAVLCGYLNGLRSLFAAECYARSHHC